MMKVTNLQISKTLVIIPLFLTAVIAADVALSFAPGALGEFFTGYSGIIIPLIAVGFYSYVGFPIFFFDIKAEVLKIRSHLAMSRIFGKELVIPQMNLTGLAIDRSGLRRKLVVTYLRNGKEVSDRFSITLLSKRKLQMLEAAIDDLQRERSPKNLHLFI